MLQFKLLRPQTLERILYVAEQLINKNVVNAKELVQCLLQQISVSRLDESSVSFKQALWVDLIMCFLGSFESHFGADAWLKR